jgi:hypothetical protein
MKNAAKVNTEKLQSDRRKKNVLKKYMNGEKFTKKM